MCFESGVLVFKIEKQLLYQMCCCIAGEHALYKNALKFHVKSYWQEITLFLNRVCVLSLIRE